MDETRWKIDWPYGVNRAQRELCELKASMRPFATLFETAKKLQTLIFYEFSQISTLLSSIVVSQIQPLVRQPRGILWRQTIIDHFLYFSISSRGLNSPGDL